MVVDVGVDVGMWVYLSHPSFLWAWEICWIKMDCIKFRQPIQYTVHFSLFFKPGQASVKKATKHATFSVTLQQNKLKSNVAHYTTHIQTCSQPPDMLRDRIDVGGKMHNIAIQLILQQCCQTSWIIFVAHFTIPLVSLGHVMHGIIFLWQFN